MNRNAYLAALALGLLGTLALAALVLHLGRARLTAGAAQPSFSFFVRHVVETSRILVVDMTKEASMSPRCYALVPASAGCPKTLRCSQRSAAKILGVPVCRSHRGAGAAGGLELWTRSLPRLDGRARA